MTPRTLVARSLVLAASGLLVLAAFWPWTSDGRPAIDLYLADGLPVSLGLVLVAVAALPAFGAAAGDRPAPALIGAAMSMTVVLVWLSTAPTAGLVTGVVMAVAAAVVLLHGAAIGGG